MYRGQKWGGVRGMCENCNGTGSFQYNISEDPMVCPCCGGSGVADTSFDSSGEFERMSDFSKIIDTLDKNYTDDFMKMQTGLNEDS
jgi:hypothetical protein